MREQAVPSWPPSLVICTLSLDHLGGPKTGMHRNDRRKRGRVRDEQDSLVKQPDSPMLGAYHWRVNIRNTPFSLKWFGVGEIPAHSSDWGKHSHFSGETETLNSDCRITLTYTSPWSQRPPLRPELFLTLLGRWKSSLRRHLLNKVDLQTPFLQRASIECFRSKMRGSWWGWQHVVLACCALRPPHRWYGLYPTQNTSHICTDPHHMRCHRLKYRITSKIASSCRKKLEKLFFGKMRAWSLGPRISVTCWQRLASGSPQFKREVAPWQPQSIVPRQIPISFPYSKISEGRHLQ